MYIYNQASVSGINNPLTLFIATLTCNNFDNLIC